MPVPVNTIGFIPVQGQSIPSADELSRCIAGRSVYEWALKSLVESEFIQDIHLPENGPDVTEFIHCYPGRFQRTPCENIQDFLSTEFDSPPERIAVFIPGYPLFDANSIDRCMLSGDSGFICGPLSVGRPSEFPIDGTLQGNTLESGRMLAASSIFSRNVIESYIHAHPSFRFGKDAQSRAKDVKLVALDVDGVLTDAGMYYAADGEAMKKFNTRDGMGIRLIRDELGIDVIWITGEDSPCVASRAKKLDIGKVFPGAKNKRALLKGYCEEKGLTLKHDPSLGDDRNDVDVMRHVGFACAPSDSYVECLRAAHFVSRYPGGGGCVRELCELLLDLHGFACAVAPPPVNL